MKNKKKQTSIRLRILRLALISVGVAIGALSLLSMIQLNYISTNAYESELETLANAYADTISPYDTENQLLSNSHLGENGLINILNENNKVIASSDKQYLGTTIDAYGAISEGAHDMGNNLVAYCKPVTGEEPMTIVIVGNLTDSKNVANYCLAINLTLGLLLCGLAIFISLRISKNIVNPIKETTNRLELLSKGDLKTEVKVFERRDETELLSKSLNLVCDELSKYVDNIVETTSEMANGDFSYSNRMSYLGDFESIPNAFEQIHNVLKDTIDNLNQSSNQVFSGSEQISSGTQLLADGTIRQANSVEGLSSVMEELSTKVETTANDAKEARDLSTKCADEMQKQNNDMESMIEAMNIIEKKSEAISEVINAIEDIAFQTNILALNASIEAARAGQAGKGFAVVANEVGALAQKSAESADSTKELITSTLDAVKSGAAIVNNTAEALKNVITISENSAKLVQRIADNANEQASAIAQATDEIASISQVTQQNSATAEESAASCEELNAQTQALAQQISKLKA